MGYFKYWWFEEDDPLTATKKHSDQREKSTVVEKRIQSINDVSEDEWLAIKRAEEAKKRTQTVEAGSKDKLLVTKHAKEAKKRLQTVASVLKPKSRFSMRKRRGLSASRLWGLIADGSPSHWYCFHFLQFFN